MKGFLALVVFLSLPAVADSVVGFEDPAVYEKVMAGTIHIEEVLATNQESTFIIRAFFPSGTPEAYVNVATNHAWYPSAFPEVKEAKTLTVNADRTEWTYWMDILIKVLFVNEHIYPEGKQVYSRPADAVSEGLLTHTVLNYGDTIKSMVERTRLIPHAGGILVHDYINYSTTEPTSFAGTVRKKLKEQFSRFMRAYRKEVSGNRYW